MRTAAIVGASNARAKFGNRAVRAFVRRGFTVFPVNPHERIIEGLKVYPSVSALPCPVDMVSLYVPPDVGLSLIDEIAACRPKEVWLNPGADSPELISRARELGLNVVTACSIIGIGETPFAF
jgi:hypothetical protein